MFEEFFKELENLDGKKLNISEEPDKDGYIDKECPHSECDFSFKVFQRDWLNIFEDESVFCPMCGHEDKAEEFWPERLSDHATDQGRKYIGSRISKALEKDAKKFNKKQSKNQFIQMKLEVKGSSSSNVILPLKAKESFQRKIKCEQCNARYAIIGSAYFCPNCGNSSVIKNFDDSIEKIRTKLDNVPIIKNAFSEIDKLDEAEITVKSLIESCLTDCVVAFQRFNEETYKQKSGTNKVPFNAFQNIERGNKLWSNCFDIGYKDWLSSDELKLMNKLFQKRHLLAHNDGIVDQMYIDKSSDENYKVGQRIVVQKKEIRKLVDLITKVSKSIKALS